MPSSLREAMLTSFKHGYYDYYIDTCKSNLHKDKEQMRVSLVLLVE